ncbi:MAG: ABC transporter ATP-binding protein [Clostridia bacterium]|nr:ABC transporter ATP-binding protein [Clostridia bacterium]
MAHLLELKDIALNYHTLKDETKAIENISLFVDSKEFISIVGPSGCGKTTLLSIIAGILSPSTGTILLDGSPLSENKNKIGYMFQRDHLFEWRTVLENVKLGLEITHNKDPANKEYLDELIEKYGLKDFVNKYPHHLSGGMRQRVALIRTLVLRPEILLLDEPFGALDYQTRKTVIQDVSSIIAREEKTSILVTHDLGEAVSLSDRIIVLSKRPSIVKATFKTNLRKIASIEERKRTDEYKITVDKIWEELQD